MTTKQRNPFGILDPFGFFEQPINTQNLLPGYSWPDSKLMNRDILEDGTTVLEYNLAGFKKDEIKATVDIVTHQLIITAEKEDRTRNTRVTLSLPQYTSPEDVKMSYEDGVLRLAVAPIEKRKEEALVEIPFAE